VSGALPRLARRPVSGFYGCCMQAVVFIIATLAYGLLGRAVLEVLSSVLSARAAAGITAALWFPGWVWLVGAVVLGSARDGWFFLRMWAGFMGALFCIAAPLALLPHPGVLAIGGIAGAAWASWCFTGSAAEVWAGVGLTSRGESAPASSSPPAPAAPTFPFPPAVEPERTPAALPATVSAVPVISASTLSIICDKPECPACHSSMRLRTARRGRHHGTQFWGCSRFPACHGTRPLTQPPSGRT